MTNIASKVLITGANGFIGRALCIESLRRSLKVGAATRVLCEFQDGVEKFVVGSIDSTTDWTDCLSSCDAVVHLAARAHVLKDDSFDSLASFRAVNVDATINLARQSALAGVKRFIFISSIGVNGELTTRDAFKADDPVSPHSHYAMSKYEAEIALKTIARETGMEVVIIRPPLVYGPKAPGNFGTLMRLVQRGLPMPLGALDFNRRSFVALDNLVDLILTCVIHTQAANQIFLVSDNEDMSTAELIRRLGKALHKPVRSLRMPLWLLSLFAIIWVKKSVRNSLMGSLQVDIAKTCRLLNWKPLLSVDDGLRLAVKGSE